MKALNYLRHFGHWLKGRPGWLYALPGKIASKVRWSVKKRNKRIDHEHWDRDWPHHDYKRTGNWIRFATAEGLGSAGGGHAENSARLFRELARALLIAHAAVILVSFNTAASLLRDNPNDAIPLSIPVVAIISAIGMILSGTASYLLAMHAAKIATGYASYSHYKFTPDLTWLQRHAFLRSYLRSQRTWLRYRVAYRWLLLWSVIVFGVAILIAVRELFALSKCAPSHPALAFLGQLMGCGG